MAYVTKKFFLNEPQKTFKFLMEKLNVSIHEAQKIIDRKRVFVEGVVLEEKSGEICGSIEVVVFQPNPIGLKPIYENDDFAIFEKPSGILIHPRKREVVQTLNDDIKFLFGSNANAAHRIDKETSGLVLVAKHKKSEADLKYLFESKQVQKEYIALVEGKLEDEMLIEEKLLIDKPESLVRIKVHVDEKGKDSSTKISPICFDEERNVSFVKAIPITGRQHQIRVHLFHVKHKIIGDPIYGLDEQVVSNFLEGKISEKERKELTKSNRLLLHANRITFEYKNDFYDIYSEVDVEKEFIKELDG